MRRSKPLLGKLVLGSANNTVARNQAQASLAWASPTVYTPIYLDMIFNPLKCRFPLWKYLNQPVFDPQSPLVLNPNQFWQRHQIEYLERCWIRAFRPEERFRSWRILCTFLEIWLNGAEKTSLCAVLFFLDYPRQIAAESIKRDIYLEKARFLLPRVRHILRVAPANQAIAALAAQFLKSAPQFPSLLGI